MSLQLFSTLADRIGERLIRQDDAQIIVRNVITFRCFQGGFKQVPAVFPNGNLISRDERKGDQRTKRGKIWKGTYGKTRPRKKKKKASEK